MELQEDIGKHPASIASRLLDMLGFDGMASDLLGEEDAALVRAAVIELESEGSIMESVDLIDPVLGDSLAELNFLRGGGLLDLGEDRPSDMLCCRLYASASDILGWNGELMRSRRTVHFTALSPGVSRPRSRRIMCLMDARGTPAVYCPRGQLDPEDAEAYASIAGRGIVDAKCHGPSSPVGRGSHRDPVMLDEELLDECRLSTTLHIMCLQQILHRVALDTREWPLDKP